MSKIHIGRGGDQLGEFTEDEVKAKLASGEFLSTDLWWKEGMEEWQPLSSFQVRSSVPSVPVQQTTMEIEPEADGLPWENKNLGFWARWWETTNGCLFSPVKTFGELKPIGGYAQPLLYFMVCAILGSLVITIIQLIVQGAAVAMGTSSEEYTAAGGALMCAIPISLGSSILGAVIGAVIGAFVGGGIIHLFLMIFGAASRGFEGTVRAVCYSGGATNALYIVPVIGWLAAIVWGPILYVISLKKVHDTDYWRVIGAVLLNFLICCGGAAAIVFAVISALYGGVSSLENFPTSIPTR